MEPSNSQFYATISSSSSDASSQTARPSSYTEVFHQPETFPYAPEPHGQTPQLHSHNQGTQFSSSFVSVSTPSAG